MSSTDQKRIVRMQEYLPQIRQAAGWTADQLAGEIGVARQTISNIERKVSRLTKVQYLALRAVFNQAIVESANDSLAITLRSLVDDPVEHEVPTLPSADTKASSTIELQSNLTALYSLYPDLLKKGNSSMVQSLDDGSNQPDVMNDITAQVPLDQIISSVAALGVPGLILVIAMGATGYVGAAALTTALAALGPGGMVGGIAILGVTALIIRGIAQYGFQTIFMGVVGVLKDKGETTDSILKKIERYPISKELKLRLKDQLGEFDNQQNA